MTFLYFFAIFFLKILKNTVNKLNNSELQKQHF